MQRGYRGYATHPMLQNAPDSLHRLSPVHAERSEMKPIKAKQSTRGNPKKVDPNPSMTWNCIYPFFPVSNRELSKTFNNAKVKQFAAKVALKNVQKTMKRSPKTILPVVPHNFHRAPLKSK